MNDKNEKPTAAKAPTPPRPAQLPHPSQVGLQEYIASRWEYVKGALPLLVAEILGVTNPSSQRMLSEAWEREYWSTRAAALEMGVQHSLRRAETYRLALEMAVIDESERAELLESAAKDVPEVFKNIPE